MSKNSIIPFLKDYLINFLTSPFLLDTNVIKLNVVFLQFTLNLCGFSPIELVCMAKAFYFCRKN